MYPGGVYENCLRVAFGDDACDTVSSGVGFGADYGDFLADQRIKQGAFPDVRRSDNGCESASSVSSRVDLRIFQLFPNLSFHGRQCINTGYPLQLGEFLRRHFSRIPVPIGFEPVLSEFELPIQQRRIAA